MALESTAAPTGLCLEPGAQVHTCTRVFELGQLRVVQFQLVHHNRPLFGSRVQHDLAGQLGRFLHRSRFLQPVSFGGLGKGHHSVNAWP